MDSFTDIALKKPYYYGIKNILGIDGVVKMGSRDGAKKTVNNPCSGLLSWNEIIEYGLILKSNDTAITDTDFKEDEQKPSGSYDLSVGDRHFLFQSNGEWKPVFLGDLSSLEEENKNLTDESFHLQLSEDGPEHLVIPPFCSAIIQLDETVDLYSVAKDKKLMIAGRFDLKLSAIYKGLISQQATQVEPCYRGKLYCFVYNLGKKEIVLEKGSKVATIEFSYVGQNLDIENRSTKISDTINYNSTTKYGNKKHFSHSVKEGSRIEYTGIGDIRWLKEVGKLPDECGIAPIYSLVTGKINDHVDTHLEKSSTIDLITDRVSNRIKEKESLLRIILTLVLAIITFFTTNLVIEVRSELRYFSEELAFFSDNYASLIALSEENEALTHNTISEGERSGYVEPTNSDISNNTPTAGGADALNITNDSVGKDVPQSTTTPDSTFDLRGASVADSLEALKAHTQELSQVRTTFWITTVVALLVIFGLLIFLFFKAFGPSKEQAWILKRKSLEAQMEYLSTEKRFKERYSEECPPKNGK